MNQFWGLYQTVCRGAGICLATIPMWCSAADGVFDVSSDFSANSNPNAAWSFGWKGTLNGAFNLITVKHLSVSANGVTIPSWQLTSSQTPAVYCNTSSVTATVGSAGTYPPGTVWYHGGGNGLPENFGVIRFTAPESGSFLLSTEVAPIYDGFPQGDTDFHVVKDGTEVFGQFLAAGQRTGYTNVVSLAAGETVDFAIGKGADGNTFGSGLKIKARITKVPPRQFNVSTDFSPTFNPAGAWSYGWAGTLGGSINLLTVKHLSTSANGVIVPSWQLTSSQTPAVYCNTSSVTATVGGNGIFPPGTVWFHPGENGRPENLGVIRFSVPDDAGGDYLLETDVAPVYDGPPQGDTDYHVLKNGSEIFGRFLAAGQRAGFTNVLPLVAGDNIDFVIGRGADGSTFGSGLKIRVNLKEQASSGVAPLILTQPENQSVTVGQSIALAVLAGGSQPLSYQWQKGTVALAGKTEASLNIPAAQLSDAGEYSVIVSNPFGSRTSSVAVVVVNLPPPPTTTFDVGADFSADSNPAGAWSYGWTPSIGGAFTLLEVKHLSQAGNGVIVPSWQLTSFQTPAVYCNTSSVTATAGNTGVFPPGTVWFHAGENGRPENFGVIRLRIPAGSGGHYRVEAAVAPVYDGAPQGDTDFHVVKNEAELLGRFLAPGDRFGYTNVLALAAGDTIDFVIGRGADGNTFGSGLKLSASLKLSDQTEIAPLILLQPSDQTVQPGSSATFEVVAAGTEPLSYQWRFNGQDIPGATESLLVLQNVGAAHVGGYSVKVWNSVGEIVSRTAQLKLASHSVEECLATIIEGLEQLAPKDQRPLAATLQAVLGSLEKGHNDAAANQLNALKNKVEAQVSRKDPAAAAALIEGIDCALEALGESD